MWTLVTKIGADVADYSTLPNSSATTAHQLSARNMSKIILYWFAEEVMLGVIVD